MPINNGLLSTFSELGPCILACIPQLTACLKQFFDSVNSEIHEGSKTTFCCIRQHLGLAAVCACLLIDVQDVHKCAKSLAAVTSK